jgi:hypothetical protein
MGIEAAVITEVCEDGSVWGRYFELRALAGEQLVVSQSFVATSEAKLPEQILYSGNFDAFRPRPSTEAAISKLVRARMAASSNDAAVSRASDVLERAAATSCDFGVEDRECVAGPPLPLEDR